MNNCLMCNAPLYDLYAFGKFCSKDCYRARQDEDEDDNIFFDEEDELDEDGNVMDEDAIAAQAIDDASWRA